MSKEKWIKRGTWISLESLNHFLKPLGTMLLSLLVIRISGPETWGQVVVYLIVAELCISFISWGQKPYLIREFAKRPANVSVIWYNSSMARLPLLLLGLGAILFLLGSGKAILYLLLLITIRVFALFTEPLIQFFRRYRISLIAESTGVISALAYIIFLKEMDVLHLLQALLFGAAVKFLILLFILPKINYFQLGFSAKEELKKSFPFFALALAGLIQSKADLYVATGFLDDSNLAFYQVLIGFLIMGQTISAMVLAPFGKNLFRLKTDQFANVKSFYWRLGVLISFTGSVAIFIILTYLYQFSIPFYYILVVFAYLIPMYAYIVESQLLLKENREKSLLTFTVISGIVNVVLSLVLIPLFGVIGALISGIICRVVIATLVVNKSKKIVASHDHR